MERDPRWNIAQSDFETLMYQKGYRGRYAMRISDNFPTLYFTNLDQSLQDYLSKRRAGKIRTNSFELETDTIDNISCKFHVALDDVKGFLIHQMVILKKIPGASQLSALFPKPNPWERFKNGRFRL